MSAVIDPSEFDRKVTFQRFTKDDDGFQNVKRWADFGHPVWARKKDVSDGERVRAGEVAASLTTRWTVMSCALTRSITAKDAISYRGISYAIWGIKEIGQNQFLEITTGAEVTNGDG